VEFYVNKHVNKLIKIKCKDGNRYSFLCTGCDCYHGVIISEKGWSFNEDMEKPTFKPSLLSITGEKRCHLYVEKGNLRFLNDCTHDLAGQVIEMENIDDI